VPLVNRITASGKIPHGKIRQLVNGLERSLKNETTVVDVAVEHRAHSRLSTREESRIAYVLAVGDEDRRDWLDFMTAEMHLTRTKIDLSHTMLDFRIHRHALSRFIQRERKLAENMMVEMREALHLASLLGNFVASYRDDGHIAIPIGNGNMMFGRVSTIVHDSPKDQAPVFRTSFSRDGEPEHGMVVRPEHLMSGGRAQVEIMTYVGDKQLTPNREKLRDRLCDFRERNKRSLAFLFDAHYHEHAAVRSDIVKEIRAEIASIRVEAERLVKGHEWDRYARSVGTGPNG
jgi:hypothetical protein